jgi:hypothetical protein
MGLLPVFRAALIRSTDDGGACANLMHSNIIAICAPAICKTGNRPVLQKVLAAMPHGRASRPINVLSSNACRCTLHVGALPSANRIAAPFPPACKNAFFAIRNLLAKSKQASIASTATCMKSASNQE